MVAKTSEIIVKIFRVVRTNDHVTISLGTCVVPVCKILVSGSALSPL